MGAIDCMTVTGVGWEKRITQLGGGAQEAADLKKRLRTGMAAEIDLERCRILVIELRCALEAAVEAIHEVAPVLEEAALSEPGPIIGPANRRYERLLVNLAEARLAICKARKDRGRDR